MRRQRSAVMRWVMAAVIVGSWNTACGPSQEELDAERARVAELQAQLEEAQSARRELDTKLAGVQQQNAEMMMQLEALGANLSEAEGARQSLQQTIEQLKARERQAQARLDTFRKLIQRFRSMIEQGNLKVRIDRERNLMLVEVQEDLLFDSGKADIKEGGEAALAQVATILKDVPDRTFQVAGHTDNVPIKTRRFPSNWELSTARAVNVAKFLIEQGMSATRLSAAGYAETQPIASNDAPEGRQQNRRIEIVLMPNLDELPDLSSLESELQGS